MHPLYLACRSQAARSCAQVRRAVPRCSAGVGGLTSRLHHDSQRVLEEEEGGEGPGGVLAGQHQTPDLYRTTGRQAAGVRPGSCSWAAVAERTLAPSAARNKRMCFCAPRPLAAFEPESLPPSLSSPSPPLEHQQAALPRAQPRPEILPPRINTLTLSVQLLPQVQIPRSQKILSTRPPPRRKLPPAPRSSPSRHL